MPSVTHLAINLALAIVGYLYWRRFYRSESLPGRVATTTIILMAVLALLGGRLAYVLGSGLGMVSLAQFFAGFTNILGWQAGYASLGMIAGAALAVLLSSLFTRYPFLGLADTFAPALLVVCAIWRVGCYFNGCCYGKPTSFLAGIVPTGGGAVVEAAHVHPTQLYEATFCLLAFLLLPLLLARLKVQHCAGLTTCLSLMTYAAGRFLIDFLRAPETTHHAAGLTLTQWGALAVLVAGIIMLPILLKRRLAA